MRQNNLIYRLVAFVMLMLFTLSITPKLFLHAVFADHTDVVYKKTGGETQVSKSGFFCDCNNQVATSPFIEQEESPESGILRVYQLLVPPISSHIITTTQLYYALRGPPALL